jgi:hypothetical protein
MMHLTRRSTLKSAASTLILAATGLTAKTLADAPLKVGVVHWGPIGDVGWEAQHALARKAMEAAFPGKVETTVVTEVTQAQDAERVFLRHGTNCRYGAEEIASDDHANDRQNNNFRSSVHAEGGRSNIAARRISDRDGRRTNRRIVISRLSPDGHHDIRAGGLSPRFLSRDGDHRSF